MCIIVTAISYYFLFNYIMYIKQIGIVTFFFLIIHVIEMTDKPFDLIDF